MPPLLDDEDAKLRRFHPKLPREAPSSKSTAEDGHVVAIDRACVRHRAVIVNHYLWQPTQLEPFAFGTTPVASHSRAFAT